MPDQTRSDKDDSANGGQAREQRSARSVPVRPECAD